MRQYVIIALLLLVAIAAVWVLIPIMFFGGQRDRYEVPEGRYDAWVVRPGGALHTPEFPPRALTGMFPSFPVMVKGVYEDTRNVLGYDFMIGVYDISLEEGQFVVDEAFRQLEEIEDMVGDSPVFSEVVRINEKAFTEPVELSPAMFHIIERSIEVSELTKGAFDITGGPVRRLWEECIEKDINPTSEEMSNAFRDARAVVGFRNIELDPGKMTIRLKKKGVTVDLHHVIRGFAMDQVAWVMENHGIKRGFVKVNHDYVLIGKPDEMNPVRLGVPGGGGRCHLTFTQDRPALVIRGTYEGFKVKFNRNVKGIIDPRFARPAPPVPSVAVIGPDAMTCEAMAIAINVDGASGLNYMIRRLNGEAK